MDEEKGKVIEMIRYITQEPEPVAPRPVPIDGTSTTASTTVDEDDEAPDDNSARVYDKTKRTYRSILDCRGNKCLTQHFETFCNYVLIHFCSVQEFRKVCSDKMISDIYTKSDEALAALLLENNADDLLCALRSIKKIPRCDARPKFTRCGDRGTKYQGWNAKGIMRFNWYMSEVAKRRGRKGGYEEEQESEMKALYRRWNGKEKTYSNMIDEEELERGADGFLMVQQPLYDDFGESSEDYKKMMGAVEEIYNSVTKFAKA